MSLLHRIQRVTSIGGGQAGPPAPVTPLGRAPLGPAPVPPTAPLAGRRPEQPESSRPTRNLDGIAALRPAGDDADQLAELCSRVQDRLIVEIGPNVDFTQTHEMRKKIQQLFDALLDAEGTQLTRADRVRLFEQVVADILGFGPIQPLLDDDSISEVMVNGPKQVYIERKGKLQRAEVTFQNDEHVMRVIDRIISPLGRRCDESSPMVDARLPDGSRVNAIIPPLSLVGPVITIRKFSKNPLTTDDLVNFGTLTPDMVAFLKACVESRLNVIVSGGTGSGKTTLLNVLSSFIPADERIVTIEDAAELQLRQEHVITLEARPANIEGKGEISTRDLVKNSLRMRPDRIIVGEVRDGAAVDMLQAMNTGHDGSMTTAHANTPRDALSRLETMVLMAGVDLPVRAIREQVASALDLVVHQARLRDGSRRILAVAEVLGMEGDTITLQDVFGFDWNAGRDLEGRVLTALRPTGLRPRFAEKLADHGVHLPPALL